MFRGRIFGFLTLKCVNGLKSLKRDRKAFGLTLIGGAVARYLTALRDLASHSRWVDFVLALYCLMAKLLLERASVGLVCFHLHSVPTPSTERF